MISSRDLRWEGCFNVRDLGGIATPAGPIRRGAIVRADAPDHLTAAGWEALEAHGVRTIIDLRNAHERPPHTRGNVVWLPLDDEDDTELWRYIRGEQLDGTPLYYRLFLERKAERCAAVLTAIVAAPPGGVLVHCVGGRDRTGLIVLLVLAAVGAAPQDIVADYELSNVRLPELWSARGEPDQRLRIAAIFARRQTTAGALLLELLDGLDVSGLLGADAAESLRRRLVAPPSLLRFVSGK